MNTTVAVQLGERSYTIQIGVGRLDGLGATAAEVTTGRFGLVVTDETVGPIYTEAVQRSLAAAGFTVAVETLPGGEQTKCLRYASQLYDRLIADGADRQSLVIALGGGVIGDLAGFVAATFARGVGFIAAPTTLLAMVDASVGGKTGVDHPLAKNMIGAFYQPLAVVCDLGCLSTLPDREFRCGLAEVVKYGVSLDGQFFEYLETNATFIAGRDPAALGHIIARSCGIKASIVAQDERERTGRRAVLNYGHTFAHAFETASGFRIRHGEAVAMGMACAGRLAERLGLVDRTVVDRQIALCRVFGLPTATAESFDPAAILVIMRRDKKAQAGKLRLILPVGLGAVRLVESVDDELVAQVIRENRVEHG